MLSIEPSRNAEQAKRYFRESLSVEDYYSEKAEIPGKWHGKTAHMLGLHGVVDKDDFEKLIDNINPNTDQRLTPRNSPNRRPLYEENRFRAVEFGSVKKLAPYYEALYHSDLGMGMREIGYDLEAVGKRWEIRKISKAIRDKYSRRTIEIEELARARGIKSARSKSQLGRLTRNEKHRSVADSVLPEIWRARLSPSELEIIESAKGDGQATGDKGRESMTAELAVNLSMQHFFERQSGVAEKRILGFAIDLSSGIIPASEILQELRKRDDIDDIIDATQGSIKFITTKDVIREEEFLAERAMAGLGEGVPLKPDHKIKNQLLNVGQEEAVQHVLKSRNKIVMISGDAGTGKTTLTVELSDAIKSTGRKMLAFAPSADASRGELRDRGFEGAETIAKLLSSPELRASLRGNVMLIDEAAMIGTPTMHQILDIAEQEKVAKVVLSGDWKQHPSVERGDAMMHLEQSGLPVARVEEIVRQRNNPAYKQVVEKVAKGIGVGDPETREVEVKQAYDNLDKQGLIVEEEDLGKCHKLIAEDYVGGSEKSPNDVLVVAPTHGEGKDVTRAIRERLKQEGRLGQEDKNYEHLINRQLTETEKQLSSYYEEGQVVEFHQNVRGFKAGSRLEVKGTDQDNNVLVKGAEHPHPVPLPLDKFKDFNLYDKQSIEIAQSDRIRITKNIRSIEGTHLNNGQIYDALGFTPENHIQLSNGATLHKDAAHFNHGTYRTSHSAQSKGSETVLLIAQ